MSSKKQIEANRQNATKSTGPKTPEGKTLSSKNATKHGLLSKQVLLPSESEEEFEELSQGLREDLKPVGALETMFVEDIAAHFWRLWRIRRIEAGVLAWVRHEIEWERARGQAKKYEKLHLEGLDFPGITIVNKQAHDKAMKAAKKARSLQEQELPTLGLAFLKDARRNSALSNVSRYEATINRAVYRTLHELQRRQAAREGGKVLAPLAVDVNVDVGPTGPADGG